MQYCTAYSFGHDATFHVVIPLSDSTPQSYTRWFERNAGQKCPFVSQQAETMAVIMRLTWTGRVIKPSRERENVNPLPESAQSLKH